MCVDGEERLDSGETGRVERTQLRTDGLEADCTDRIGLVDSEYG